MQEIRKLDISEGGMEVEKIIKFLFFSSILLFFSSGCTSASSGTDIDLFQYKGSYVGDNSAVVNTIIHLKGNEYFDELELKTKEEPYGINVDYAWSESGLESRETAVNNATYLFALIRNVDWVSFEFEMPDGTESYKITRENLQAWYGTDLSEIDNEGRLQKLIQSSVEDKKKMDQLFK